MGMAPAVSLHKETARAASGKEGSVCTLTFLSLSSSFVNAFILNALALPRPRPIASRYGASPLYQGQRGVVFVNLKI